MSGSVNGKLNGVINDKALQALAGNIGPEWRDLARELGLDNSDIYSITQDHRDRHREIVYQIFVNWKQRLGNDATADKLAKALRDPKVNRADLADKLEGKKPST